MVTLYKCFERYNSMSALFAHRDSLFIVDSRFNGSWLVCLPNATNKQCFTSGELQEHKG